MPWCWRPLLGPYWVENTRVEDNKENKRQDSKKKESSYSMQTFHLQVNNKKAAASSSENSAGAVPEEESEAAGQEKAQGEKQEAGINANNKFKQIRPGVYTFAGTGAPGQESKESKTPEQFTPAPAAIPSSMYGFKKIGVSRDGLPVYTFT